MTPKTTPFTFDQAFDRDGRTAPSARAVQRKTLTVDEIETLKRDAQMVGQRAAEQGHIKRQADMLALIAQKIEILSGALDEAVQPVRAEAVSLAYVTALKLVRVLLAREPEAEIKALVARCIEEQKSEPHLVLRVNDTLHDTLRDSVKEMTAARGFGGRILVIGEPETPIGDCRIEWADGGLERNLNGALTQIETVIRNFVLRLEGHPDALPAPQKVMEEAPAPDEPRAEPQLSIEGV